MKKIKKTIMLGIMFSLLSSSAMATTGPEESVGSKKKTAYQVRVVVKESFSTYKFSNNETVGDWFNVGGRHDCTTWTPSQNTVDWGVTFVQSRDCRQDQERKQNRVETDSFSGIEKRIPLPNLIRALIEGETISVTGLLERWVRISNSVGGYALYNNTYSGYSPSPEGRVSFTQTRNRYKHYRRYITLREQHNRTGEIRNISGYYENGSTSTVSESRYVRTYSCPRNSSYGYKAHWSGCSQR